MDDSEDDFVTKKINQKLQEDRDQLWRQLFCDGYCGHNWHKGTCSGCGAVDELAGIRDGYGFITKDQADRIIAELGISQEDQEAAMAAIRAVLEEDS